MTTLSNSVMLIWAINKQAATYQIVIVVLAGCRRHVRGESPMAPDVRPQVLDEVAVCEP
jgi:hypothetical protein